MRIRLSALCSCLAAIPLAALLSGCALTETASPTAALGSSIKGNVHGGQQPVVGAHVYLMAANTTTYGASSVSLLLPNGLTDSIGSYVTTASDGSFSITGDYACTSGTQVYVYALGGNPGAGVNSAAGFLAALGQCPAAGTFVATVPFIYVNEVSTVAAAFSIAGYATDALHVSSSGSSLAQTGIATAFANATNLASISTGTALTATPLGNGIVPQATINTLANILAACVNSTGPTSTPCATLFANALSAGSSGTVATDTATAAINIAHNPGVNVSALYGLTTPTLAFSPALTSAPNDFTIGVVYTGTGATGGGLNGPVSIAIDTFGDVWVVNSNNSSISKFTGNGTPLSPPTGFVSGGQIIPVGIAIDGSQNAWVADSFTSKLTEYGTTGVPSPTSPYSGGGLSAPQGVAIFGTSAVWTPNIGNNSVSKFNTAGVAQSPANGYTAIAGILNPVALAVDQVGAVWIANKGAFGTTGSVSRLASDGSAISGPSGYTGGGINFPFAVAVDRYDNVWVANYTGNSVTELNAGGNVMSPSTGYTGGGISRPYGIALDGANNAWTANFGNNTVSQFASAGASVSPVTGYATTLLNGPQAVAVDGAGSLWVANSNASSITQLVGIATPVVTPISTATVNGTLATRP